MLALSLAFSETLGKSAQTAALNSLLPGLGKREPRRSGAVSESYFFSSGGGNDVCVGAHCQTLTLPSLTSLQSLAAAAVEMIGAAAITNGFISTSPNGNSPIAPA